MLNRNLTLNNKARCLQRPTERLPIGTTTDPKQSFRSSLLSLHMGTNSSSPTEAEPLVIEIRTQLHMNAKHRCSRKMRIECTDNLPHAVAYKFCQLIYYLFCSYASTRKAEDPILEFL